MNQLKTKLEAILVEKGKIEAKNMVNKGTIFGITGSISDGRNTTVNGGVPNNFTITDDPDTQNVQMVMNDISFGSTGGSGAVLDNTTTVRINPFKNDVARGIGLTADKILEGNIILGISGTAKEAVDITTTEDYQSCISLANDILGATE